MNEDLVANGLVFDSETTNVRYDFRKMTKRFGKHYIEYLQAAHAAKDDMTDTVFSDLNGAVPSGFLQKLVV